VCCRCWQAMAAPERGRRSAASRVLVNWTCRKVGRPPDDGARADEQLRGAISRALEAPLCRPAGRMASRAVRPWRHLRTGVVGWRDSPAFAVRSSVRLARRNAPVAGGDEDYDRRPKAVAASRRVPRALAGGSPLAVVEQVGRRLCQSRSCGVRRVDRLR